jgi:hypothetical protein
VGATGDSWDFDAVEQELVGLRGVEGGVLGTAGEAERGHRVARNANFNRTWCSGDIDVATECRYGDGSVFKTTKLRLDSERSEAGGSLVYTHETLHDADGRAGAPLMRVGALMPVGGRLRRVKSEEGKRENARKRAKKRETARLLNTGTLVRTSVGKCAR